jgi:hypothetical protein
MHGNKHKTLTANLVTYVVQTLYYSYYAQSLSNYKFIPTNVITENVLTLQNLIPTCFDPYWDHLLRYF